MATPNTPIPPLPPLTLKQKLSNILNQFDQNLKTLLGKIAQDAELLWGKDKLLFTLLAGVFLIAKYRDLMMDLIVASANRLVKKTQQQNTALQKQETADEQKASTLIQQANQLPNEEKPVTDDWNKKQ